jgi:23S rRNA (pseudouridine1915-N3)-methyltransferase
VNLTILSVGKIKEKYLQEALGEYQKRLGSYCSLTMIEVKDEKTKENPSDREIAMIQNVEGERILGKIKPSQWIITLEIDGEAVSSEDFARQLGDYPHQGVSDLVFVIGGSLGLSKAVKQAAMKRISFSRMTFPHQLMRVILLEQIYRAYRILRREPYHK